MRYTKIVCTIGPSSGSEDRLRALVRAGMDVARLNFAHGTHEEHAAKIRAVRKISSELDRPVAILQDLAGPKIRVGEVPEPGVVLRAGQKFCLCAEPCQGSESRVSVTYPGLAAEVFPGDPILLADGLLEIEVIEISDQNIICRVVTGGLLTSHKGINLPTRTLSAPTLTEKDRNDLAFGLAQGVDYVGVSFVRSAQDILEVKKLMAGRRVPVVAKIEKHEAVACMDAILEAADGVMVARGDLGVEIPLETVPEVQKKLIAKANAAGKPVITATQMLRSMVDSPRPTRAEAADVANAVFDGTDAVMLSEETASGSYPVESVSYMDRIAARADASIPTDRLAALEPSKDVAESVAHAACVLAEHLEASAIVASTVSGKTARLISRFRPRRPIIALTPERKALLELALVWGCAPFPVPAPEDADDLITSSGSFALKTGLVKKGDTVVITAGHPVGGAGTTNILRVMRL